MYPVMLNLQDKRCLVVGGGGVALRKIEGLLDEGARLRVVASKPVRSIVELASQGRIELIERPYEHGDVEGHLLVFAATDERAINRMVFEEAREQHIWVNVADDPELCTFHLPARVRRGAFQLALGSAGEAPFVVRRLRQLLERRFGLEWAEWMKAAADFRSSVRQARLPRIEQEHCYDAFFASTVDDEQLRARVPSDAETSQWLSTARRENAPVTPPAAHSRTNEVPEPREKKGFVSLVGAGPGDPGLLTLRARQRLMRADAIVYDRLAMTALPTDLPARAELRSVGKEAGHHPLAQEEINALLVRLGSEGKRVVRLKGGDPYVFGRGGEEAEALRGAGIPFEVVPCVTAGVAVPAYAGIPVTQRREAVRVTMVTAHEASKSRGAQVRWDLLAADAHATIVGYMGVTSLPDVVHELLGAGMNPTTPAAMIERGTTSAQRILRSPLCELPESVAKAGFKPPALFVIGRTVQYAESLDWFMQRPLFGERLGMFSRATPLGDALEMAGAEVIEAPMPLTDAARIVIGALPVTGWLLADSDEVDSLEEERSGHGWASQATAWTLSSSAAARARELGWTRVVELPADADTSTIVEAIREQRTRP